MIRLAVSWSTDSVRTSQRGRAAQSTRLCDRPFVPWTIRAKSGNRNGPGRQAPTAELEPERKLRGLDRRAGRKRRPPDDARRRQRGEPHDVPRRVVDRRLLEQPRGSRHLEDPTRRKWTNSRGRHHRHGGRNRSGRGAAARADSGLPHDVRRSSPPRARCRAPEGGHRNGDRIAARAGVVRGGEGAVAGTVQGVDRRQQRVALGSGRPHGTRAGSRQLPPAPRPQRGYALGRQPRGGTPCREPKPLPRTASSR